MKDHDWQLGNGLFITCVSVYKRCPVQVSFYWVGHMQLLTQFIYNYQLLLPMAKLLGLVYNQGYEAAGSI